MSDQKLSTNSLLLGNRILTADQDGLKLDGGLVTQDITNRYNEFTAGNLFSGEVDLEGPVVVDGVINFNSNVKLHIGEATLPGSSGIVMFENSNLLPRQISPGNTIRKNPQTFGIEEYPIYGLVISTEDDPSNVNFDTESVQQVSQFLFDISVSFTLGLTITLPTSFSPGQIFRYFTRMGCNSIIVNGDYIGAPLDYLESNSTVAWIAADTNNTLIRIQ